MQPCQNCVSWNLTCEVGVSRRGKYPRKKKGLARTSTTPNNTANESDSRVRQRQFPLPGHSSQYPPARPTIADDAIHKTVFFGESSPLTCVVDEGRRSPDKGYACSIQKGRLHYSISEISGVTESSQDSLGPRKLIHDRLSREGALIFPSPAVCDALLQAYFDWFHPCFPILDRADLQSDYEDGTLSPLLFQSMLFIGVSLCSDTALNTTGFNNRYQAKEVFYQRAKDIYDSGWETDTVIKLQSLFLLSFWRGSPTEERDVRFWLGAAIGLAQKKGMHVMSKLSFLNAKDQKIWKRIWWALYVRFWFQLYKTMRLTSHQVRDQQTSAALGLPPRIRDEDCQIADLETADFDDRQPMGTPVIFRTPPEVHIPYVIGMIQLARLLREIVCSQYLPGRSKLDNEARPMLRQRLVDWESRLPKEMQFQMPMSRDSMFLVGMLHMAYNNLYILLYRPLFLQLPGQSVNSEGNVALEAATRSTRILEDMLSENLVQHGSVHLITHTFSALCIHTIHFGRTKDTVRNLAEHRAKLCLLGLKELQKSWDLENWVLDLFFRCLDDRTARDLRLADTCMPSLIPQTGGGRNIEEISPVSPASGSYRPLSPNAADHPLHTPNTMPHHNPGEEAAINMDWYDLFNVEGDDVMGLAGSLSNPDYLNPQNLEFLYRFL
ncbi:hypothetical protein N7491_006026 [Penicillium cf. griseofulvum]|uniref:Xylanolytic transcriptional activator regulatory domain-containing protein n=1 Tax=Penicillium cf. griseofulvum TaxID=2972120 RepID=A0A9W9IW06_9EURO|nr:hypothetical protein N7472_010943 [Penicillium cf. griseofulvum]KAJ5429010.1 hypothetical protein N7491_006026 [Penicillium cf. griseofulvum]KAJ5437199.1 hypothetical protein N7445_008084 [Penicillium cf. griseofulvum]